MTKTSASAARSRTDFSPEAIQAIASSLNALLSDLFALYMKTKNFHWHMWGPHFRDFHLLLDAQANQIYAATDIVAERVRKLGASTLRSIGDISRRQRLSDSDAESGAPLAMLQELCEDNVQLATFLREAHGVCDEHGDVATASLLETWLDEAEQRIWYLFETCQKTEADR